MTLIHATLDLKYHREEFDEYCTENGVTPDLDMLRSWLMERAVADEVINSVKLCCLDPDCACVADLN